MALIMFKIHSLGKTIGNNIFTLIEKCKIRLWMKHIDSEGPTKDYWLLSDSGDNGKIWIYYQDRAN